LTRAHHGIAIFTKNQLRFTHTGNSNEKNPTEWISVNVENTSIVNMYHPSPAVLDISHLPLPTPDNFILAGDLNLNCKHTNWGYPDSNNNDKILSTWASANYLITLYDPKQPASFHLER